jgi:hypothetical protein
MTPNDTWRRISSGLTSYSHEVGNHGNAWKSRVLSVGVRAGVLSALIFVSCSDAPATNNEVGEPKTEVTVAVAGEVLDRSPLVRPFADNSPWNTPISSGVTYTPPGNRLRASGRAWINSSECGVPVYSTSLTGKKVVLRSSNSYNGGHGPLVAEVTVDVVLEPSNCPGPYMAIVDEQNGVVYDLWSVTRRTDTEIVAEGMIKHSLTGSGFGELTGGLKNGPLYAGTRASGANRLAGLLTGAAVDSGRIDHALAICLHESSLGDPPVPPAVDRDSSKVAYRGSTPMGGRLAIPPGTNRPDLSPLGAMVWDAFVTYGGYVVDACGGTFGLYADPRTLSDDDLHPLLGRESGKADLDRIVDNLQVVKP